MLDTPHEMPAFANKHGCNNMRLFAGAKKAPHKARPFPDVMLTIQHQTLDAGGKV
ncbi:MAG: hypothetical protein ACOYD7_00820 [Raoultibacter sp.]